MSASAGGRRSPLELLLARGFAASALVLGSACPERLRPSAEAGAEGSVELVVVAPTPDECDRAWTARAVDSCAARLAPEGLAVLLLPARLRPRAGRLLRARGLVLEPALLHLPDTADPRQLVPLERTAARLAFSRVVPLRPWKRALAGALFRVGAGRALALAAPGCALVARREGGRAPLEWLVLPGGPPRSAVLSSSSRRDASSVVVHPVTRDGAALMVAKVDLVPGRAGDEGEHLRRLGPAARAAGARVPEPVAALDLGGVPALVERRVDGTIAATLLTRRPALLDDVLARVSEWLARWQLGTATRHPLSAELLERELLDPAAQVAPLIEGGAGYLAALRARCKRLAGSEVPLTAAHNDLTMWNVLWSGHGPIGVVDWEAAEEAALPLKDFFYAAVDAVAATSSYRDRAGAFRDCFGADGAAAELVRALEARPARELAIEPALRELAFHACWLGHAANEARASGTAGERPFLEIVREAAATLRP